MKKTNPNFLSGGTFKGQETLICANRAARRASKKMRGHFEELNLSPWNKAGYDKNGNQIYKSGSKLIAPLRSPALWSAHKERKF